MDLRAYVADHADEVVVLGVRRRYGIGLVVVEALVGSIGTIRSVIRWYERIGRVVGRCGEDIAGVSHGCLVALGRGLGLPQGGLVGEVALVHTLLVGGEHLLRGDLLLLARLGGGVCTAARHLAAIDLVRVLPPDLVLLVGDILRLLELYEVALARGRRWCVFLGSPTTSLVVRVDLYLQVLVELFLWLIRLNVLLDRGGTRGVDGSR